VIISKFGLHLRYMHSKTESGSLQIEKKGCELEWGANEPKHLSLL
jgi:hypothetical protein